MRLRVPLIRLVYVVAAALPWACNDPQHARGQQEMPAEIPGWIRAGSAPQDYEMGIDHHGVLHGAGAAYLKARTGTPEGFGTLMQMIQPGAFKGKRVRLSAYVRAADVTDWAGLWMRVDGKDGSRPLAFYNMQDRPVHGTSDWTRREAVLDVGADAVDIAFGVLLSGGGTVWLDDVSLGIVDESVPVTKLDGSSRWMAGGSTPGDYAIGEDPAPVRSGATTTAFLRAKGPSAAGFGTWMRSVPAADLRGKRVRLSAWVEATDVRGWAGLWMRVEDPSGKKLAFDNMQGRPIQGTSPWTRYDVVLDVPANAAAIAYGTLLAGVGSLRMADVGIESVDAGVPLTQMPDPTRWLAAGDKRDDYDMGEDPAPVRPGATTTAFLRAKGPSAAGFGTWMRSVLADDLRGKRVRLSGWVEATQVHDWAGLWMRVDGPAGKVLAFDNMRDRPVQGTRPWARYEVVLDIPSVAQSISYGTLLAGPGSLRMADVAIEAVDSGVPVTQPARVAEAAPTGVAPVGGYSVAGSAPEAFEIAGDPSAPKSSGGASLRSKTADPAGFATLMKTVDAAPFRGKKVRLTGQVEAEDVRGWAGLWVRLDDRDGKPMAFDNMQDRPIRGTAAWAGHEVVLDVPVTAARVAFGALLSGAGRVDVADLALGPADVADSTDLVRPRRAPADAPRNLGFEE